MKYLLHLVIGAVLVWLAAQIVPGVMVTPLGAILAALVLGLLNVFVKPVITILTLPITILTLGLFSLIINALLVLLTAMIVPGFHVDSFFHAAIFAILLALMNIVLNAVEG